MRDEGGLREGVAVIPIMISALVFASAAAGGPRPDMLGAWTAPSTRCETLAEGLRIAPALRPVVVDMCRRAPTFRRQVARIARQSGLEVTIAPGLFPATGRTRARTAMTRVEGLLRTASIEVPTGDSLLVVELVAHEFEHVLEQLDGVDLAHWVGRSGVYRLGGGDRDGPFETERARRVGRLVASEYAAEHAELTALKVR
jgi:hypothetical protein